MDTDKPSSGSSDPNDSTAGYTLGGARPELPKGAAVELLPGTKIGEYLILEKIGPGGFGVVYKAREELVSRYVALKMIRPEMSAPGFVERFNEERKVLAALNHPNIVKLFTAGNHVSQPYFTMEYVEGLPLTNYADEKKFTISQRLELFSQVCKAVKFAHRRGIIHRDIKPSNILAAEEIAGEPIVKLIDFGIAKIISGDGQKGATLHTKTGQPIGTVEYMSPEQARGEKIDVRTDVYSLGVVLYELLVGCHPFNFKGLSDFKKIQLISDGVQQTPSHRIKALTLAECQWNAELRKLSTSEFLASIPRALDKIVSKALAANEHHRYQTVSSFLADLDSFLAKTDARKSLKKFFPKMRRMKQIIIFAVLAILTLLIILLGEHLQRESEQSMSRVESQLGQVDLRLPTQYGDQMFSSNDSISSEKDLTSKNYETLKKIDPSQCPARFRSLWSQFFKDYSHFMEIISFSSKRPAIGTNKDFDQWVDSAVNAGVNCKRDKDLLLHFQ